MINPVTEKYSGSVGVCTHFESRDIGWKVEKLLPYLKELGCGHVRQEIKWEWVEQEQGKFEIPVDSMTWVDEVTKAGLGVILILNYGNPIYENTLDPDGFARYAGYMAARLKGYPIIAYEIWNEPTNFQFLGHYGGSWSGAGDSLWLDKFSELVEKAAAAIRQEDPAATIITNPGEPQFFHMAAKRPESLREIDGISHHPYPVRLPPETLPLGGGEISAHDGVVCADDSHSFQSLFQYSIAHGEKHLGKRLLMYATEFGFSTYNATAQPRWAAGYNEAAQACFLVREIILSFTAGVYSPCVYDLMDDGVSPYDGEQNFGLLRNEARDYSPKPSFHAVKRLISLLGREWEFIPQPPVHLEVTIGQFDQGLVWQRRLPEPFIKINGPMLYWFKNKDRCVCFVWKAGRIDAEGNPPVGQIIYENAPPINNVTMVDTVSGEELPVTFQEPPLFGQYSMRKILKDVPFRASPVAICWEMAP